MKVLLIYIGLISVCISVYSQSDSLDHYLKTAVQNNPGVLQKLAEYEAALQKVPQVGALPDPELSLGVFLSPMEQLSGNQVADIRLMQMFPWFGVLKNAKDEMSLMAKAKYQSFRDAKLQLFYNVQRDWYELNKVHQNIRISQKNIEILHSLERLELVRFKAGLSGNATQGAAMGSGGSNNNPGVASGMSAMGGKAVDNQVQQPAAPSNGMAASVAGSGLVDVYRIQIEIGELSNNIAMLNNQQNTLVAQFNASLNRSATTSVALPDVLEPDTLVFALKEIADSMLIHNPMLMMLQYEQQSFDARNKMVTRMGYPMVGVGMNYSLINKSEMSTSSMNGKDMVMPMVTVTLPIYRKKYNAMAAETRLMKSATQQGYQATVNALQTEYYQAFQLFDDSQRRIRLYENQSLLSQKSLDIMLQSFSVSGIGLADVLRIRQQLLDYEFKHVEAIADYNTSIAWLKRLGCREEN